LIELLFVLPPEQLVLVVAQSKEPLCPAIAAKMAFFNVLSRNAAINYLDKARIYLPELGLQSLVVVFLL
jgi:hypothetical protein